MTKEPRNRADFPGREEYGWGILKGYCSSSGLRSSGDSLLCREEPPAGKPDPGSHGTVSRMNGHSSWLEKVDKAVRESCRFMLETQHSEGYWWAELESNVTITSEYLMLFHLLGCVDSEREKRLARHLLNQQRSDGTWGLYHGDEGDISTSIEAYFALKLAGFSPKSGSLSRASDFILSKGGIESARVFTKIWLALFAQYDWNRIPTMPVELVLIPSSYRFSIYEFSSWTRSTVVPLSIVMAMRPRHVLPPERGVSELYDRKRGHLPHGAPPTSLQRIFSVIDRTVKWLEQHHPFPGLRRQAFRAAEQWILEHQEPSGDWGGIQPCMINSILALRCLGYPLDHPVIVKGLEALNDFCIEDEDGLRLQSCISPVWDTALNCLALLDAGVPPDHPSLQAAASWLGRNQITTGGDWQCKSCCPPGGWAFEFENSNYPDVDDSAVVLMALQRLWPECSEAMESCKRKGLEWCLGMQSSCGGWAAFDKDNTLMILNQIPFADHDAMVDYPTADITGRMLEAMGHLGLDRSHPKAKRAIEFIRRTQEHDGCWWGRWGVNYIYGTWSVIRGLMAIGEDPKSPCIQAAVKWLKDHQNPDGGWGETCESYRKPELRGQGASTPSQTAWALMAIMATGEAESPEVYRGVGYLVRNQRPEGSWDEEHYTGTGFPKHFYIRYLNYRNCFPLMALGQYLQNLKKRR